MNFDWNDYPDAIIAMRINLAMRPLHVVQEWLDDSATGWRNHDWCYFTTLGDDAPALADATDFANRFAGWLIAMDNDPIRRVATRTTAQPKSYDALVGLIHDSQRRQNLKPKKRRHAQDSRAFL